jgi:hypothetical protein
VVPWLQTHYAQAKLSPEIAKSLKTVAKKDLEQSSSAELRKVGKEFGAFFSHLREVVRMPEEKARSPQPQRTAGPHLAFAIHSLCHSY